MISIKLRTAFFSSKASRSSTYSLVYTLSLLERNLSTDAYSEKARFDPKTYHSDLLMPSNLRKGIPYSAYKVLDEMPHNDIFTLNRMLSGYTKNGCVKEARDLFDSMKDRNVNVVSWTIMIGMLSDAGCFSEAVSLFQEMQCMGVAPDCVTILKVLSLCTDPNASVFALQIHTRIIKSAFGCSLAISNTLIDAYCKCGLTKLAFAVFEEMEQRDSRSHI